MRAHLLKDGALPRRPADEVLIERHRGFAPMRLIPMSKRAAALRTGPDVQLTHLPFTRPGRGSSTRSLLLTCPGRGAAGSPDPDALQSDTEIVLLSDAELAEEKA